MDDAIFPMVQGPAVVQARKDESSQDLILSVDEQTLAHFGKRQRFRVCLYHKAKVSLQDMVMLRFK